MLDCQSAAAAEFKVGKSTLQSQHAFAHAFMGRSPLRAKDEQGVEHTMEYFFIHGLGHYLGMDVHDVGDTSRPCVPGEVFTIEPGIYIPSEGFGVRIEDDYLVTKDGLEKLSKGIPCEVEEIERRMAEAAGSSPGEGRRPVRARRPRAREADPSMLNRSYPPRLLNPPRRASWPRRRGDTSSRGAGAAE